MSLNRIMAIVLRQFYLLRGSPARILPLFIWVAIDIVLWGFMTRYLNGFALPGMDFVAMILGSVLLWDFCIRIMHGVSMAFFEDVWSRNFLNIFATPLLIPEYVTGLVVTSVMTSSVGVLVMLGLASGVFGLSFLIYGLTLVPFIILLFIFGTALGIAGCAIVLRLGPAAEWLIWPIPAILAPFVGVFYPVSVLPGWMQLVSRVLPPSYVFEGMRIAVAGGGFSSRDFLAAGCLSLAYVLLAYLFFDRTYQHALKTGLIARYSAENLS
jgi:ABC-2 type transport system permease protein